jgi:hypothetical protein
MPDVITLVLPQGGYDFPPSHGPFGFIPYRLSLRPSAAMIALPDQGGPWAIDIPADRLDIVGTFLRGNSGCYVYEDPQTAGAGGETAPAEETGTGEPAAPTGETGTGEPAKPSRAGPPSPRR